MPCYAIPPAVFPAVVNAYSMALTSSCLLFLSPPADPLLPLINRPLLSEARR